MDFDDVASKPATQEFEIPVSREVGEYQLRYDPFRTIYNTNRALQTRQILQCSERNTFYPRRAGSRKCSIVLCRIHGFVPKGELIH
jgi:hypothetical protein